jgi:type IV pilus assembly protein PilY1
VYYGANDGVFRAVNGNQTTGSIGGVPPGDELWGLVLTEHFDQYNRQRLASPALKFPTTTLSSARPKDYFVDGPTASYQRTKADGTIDKAYIFVTMRRGGRFMYALDVSDPLVPKVMWKIAETDAAFTELGQTWSRPRATLVQGGRLAGQLDLLEFGDVP